MNSQLVLIQHWIVASKMSLNHSKFIVMWFKASSRKKSVEFPDIIIEYHLANCYQATIPRCDF